MNFAAGNATNVFLAGVARHKKPAVTVQYVLRDLSTKGRFTDLHFKSKYWKRI